MRERLVAELELVKQQFGELEHGADGEYLIVNHLYLPAGWDRTETPLLFFVPSGYPITPPDNFYVADMRLATGAEPGNSSAGQAQLGQTWRMLSWHLDDVWAPKADPAKGDNLVTFILKCRERLEDLS